MGSPPVFRTGANFDSAGIGVQGKTGPKRLISLSFCGENSIGICLIAVGVIGFAE
jgi:hypothetical protein